MKKMRTAVDNVNWDMPIMIRNGSNLFIPLNLYVFELNEVDGCYHPCSKEETCNDDCFLYAKFTLPEDWDKNSSGIRIRIDDIDFHSPGSVTATVISNDSKYSETLVGELQGDIVRYKPALFEFPKRLEEQQSLICYNGIKNKGIK